MTGKLNSPVVKEKSVSQVHDVENLICPSASALCLYLQFEGANFYHVLPNIRDKLLRAGKTGHDSLTLQVHTNHCQPRGPVSPCRYISFKTLFSLIGRSFKKYK